jgi:crotonobetainyl-CoA:carnitine CoA-transferase CaiB-like acyl-CoA transferase
VNSHFDLRRHTDEVVQMMGGLACMTGPPGDPLRAGTSVNDIMGGMFGAIGVLAAPRQRDRTGRGTPLQTALFENNVLLTARHMMQYAVNGRPRRCPAASAPGGCTTCSRWPKASRSSWRPSATRGGSCCATNSASPT